MSLKTYFQESVQELHQVTWPTQKQAIRITTVVFIFMIASAVAMGFVDQLLTLGFEKLLSLSQ